MVAHTQFVILKTYDWAKDSLRVSSPMLFPLCRSLERIVTLLLSLLFDTETNNAFQSAERIVNFSIEQLRYTA